VKIPSLKHFGFALLLSYLAVVVGIEIIRLMTNWPIVSMLASSPNRIANGEWWRLITSALIIEGPPLPQIFATAILGGLIIWFRGSWFFWVVTGAGHVLGTLLTYLGVLAAGVLGPHALNTFLADPDYGISLVWCSALGVISAAAWLGPQRTWKVPFRPWLSGTAVVLMLVVIFGSPVLEGVQHAVAFIVGVALIAMFDPKARVSRHPSLRPVT
jgi:hypothetical protein